MAGGRTITAGARPPLAILLTIYGVLTLCAAYPATLIYLNGHNTLHNNGRWVSEKVGLDRGVMGAVAAMVTRVTLFRNRLNLGAYFGHQQFVLRDRGAEIKDIRFKFHIPRQGYLDVLFGPDRRNLFGIRISSHRDFRNIHYRVSPAGEFLATFALPGGDDIRLQGWNWAQVRFEDSRVAVTLNGIPLGEAYGTTTPVRTIGVRGSLAPVLLDDVEVSFADGGTLTETFSYSRGFVGPFGIVGALLALLIASYHALLRRFTRLDAATVFVACVVGYGIFAAAVAMFAAVDFYYLAGRYPDNPFEIDFKGYENRIEKSGDVKARLVGIQASLAASDDYKIMLVGSSQTWGAGARRPDDVLDRVLERKLNASAGPSRRFRVVNTGISALNSSQLLESYRTEWIRIDPDLVVLNLSSSDAWSERKAGQKRARFRGNLEAFLRINAARNIKTVLVLEANSEEIEGEDRSRLQRAHAVMRTVAQEHELPLVDMHGLLGADREKGFLWWDKVHLTSFGQALFAEQLSRHILATVCRDDR